MLLQAPRHHAKKSSGHAAKQGRPDVKAAREAWFEGQLGLDPDALVFIDETAATTAMARRYGRAPRGERCRMSVPQSHVWTPPRAQAQSRGRRGA
jgi:hypothetical protein